MKCDCKVVGPDHDEWCNMHPQNIYSEELEERIAMLVERSAEQVRQIYYLRGIIEELRVTLQRAE